ncbi:hypothetical protein BOX15_Mlig015778g2 [Macrostomum lignano]|uniref:Uncharacterized protein n=1 Tax=Macrostomum lignano TaxID=282301 RepID=A0A267GC75_9PLAT|nr:hypothetical protein BOX15_Mlig015778g2 [Macrostomum lignano]
MTSLALAERIKELLKQRQDLQRRRRRKATSTTSCFGSGDSNKVQLNKRRLRASVDGLPPPPPPPPPESWLGAISKIPAFEAASSKSARAAAGFLSQLESTLNAPPQPLPPRRQRQAQRGRRSHRGAAGRLRCCQPVRQHHVAATSGCCRRVPELRIARVSPLPAASGRHHYSNRSPVRHRVQRCRCCFRQTAPGCLADAEVENCPAMRIYCQSEDDYLLPDCAEEANFLSWTVSANLRTPPQPTVSMATVTDEARGVTWDSGDPLDNKKKNCCC